MAKSTTFARLQYASNRDKSGRLSTAGVRQTVRYFAHGIRGRQRELRGRWYGPDGATTHEEVSEWALQNARAHTYTYQAVLSTRDGRLTGKEFCRVLAASGRPLDWRLIRHTDTEHDHAHVLFFSRHPLSRKQVTAWSEMMRGEIQALVRQKELAAALEKEQEAALEQKAALAQGAGLEQAAHPLPAKEVIRGPGPELSL